MSSNTIVQNVKKYVSGSHRFINVGTGSTSVSTDTLVTLSKSTIMTIENGNVGVGTTIATSLLTINGQTTIHPPTPSVTWISGHSNYNYTINGISYNSSINSSFSSSGINSPSSFANAMAINTDGELYLWGYNDTFGLLNIGSSTISSQLTPNVNNYGSLSGKKIVAISGGTAHSIALDNNGELHVWGNNASGRLGIGTTGNTIYTACNISSYGSLVGKKIIAISCDGASTYALDSTGEVHGWGWNVSGEIGFGSTIPSYVTVACNISAYGSLKGKTIVAINPLMALDNTGQVHAWGDNRHGIYGFGYDTSILTTSCNISSYGSWNGKTITAIASSAFTTTRKSPPIGPQANGIDNFMLLDNEGNIHTSGDNFSGLSGIGTNISYGYVTKSCNISSYGSLNGRTITSILHTTFNNYALDSFGQIHAWGDNSRGQLGNGTTTNQNIPINISTNGSLYGKTITQISSGYQSYVVFALDNKGSLYSWGGNQSGLCGIGNTIHPQSLPITIPTFRKNKLYLSDNTIDLDGPKIASDSYLTGIAISTTGTSNAVVINNNGNVGIGTTNPLQKLHVVGNVLATGTVTAGNISVLGDFVTLNTITSNTEQMVITNAGTGPALKVTQTGNNSVAEFYDNESGIALFVGNNGNVGIGTTNPQATLDIQGNQIISGTIQNSNKRPILNQSGSILNVLNAYSSGTGNITPNTTQDIITLSITPSTSSSKILVTAAFHGERISGGSLGSYLTISLLRNSVNLVALNNGFGYQANPNSRHSGNTSYLDSPSTTSTITYKINADFTTSGGATYAFYGITLTCMEIAG